MRADQPSQTALRSAMRRAAHQIWDDPPVYRDPLALKLVGAGAEASLRAGDPARFNIERTIRAFMAARSRVAGDEWAAAMARGVRQCVVMGAGLDTTAFQPAMPDLRIFEIDHPATQAWKKARLEQAGIAADHVAFVPVDFTVQTLADELPRAGWNAAEPTFFTWLGVTSYLPQAAVMETLRFVAACPKGSAIVFDVSTTAAHVSLYERAARLAYGFKILITGEPSGTRFDPAALGEAMRALGFGEVRHLDGPALNAAYFAGRTDGLKVSNRSAVMIATV